MERKTFLNVICFRMVVVVVVIVIILNGNINNDNRRHNICKRIKISMVIDTEMEIMEYES